MQNPYNIIKTYIPNRFKQGIKDKFHRIFPPKPEPYPSYMLYGKKIYMDYIQVLAFYHIEKYKTFGIYGHTAKTEELIDSIKLISPSADIVACADISKGGIDCSEWDILSKNIPLDAIDCLIIALPLEFTDIRYELVKNASDQEILPEIVDIYAIDRFVPEFYHPDIEKYKGIHNGKRCFVIGNGPSLTAKDLDVLHEHGEICFASNGIYDIYSETDWREDYYTVVDRGIIPYLKENFNKIKSEIFVKDEYNYDISLDKNSLKKVNYIHMLQGQADINHPPFSFDLSHYVYDGGTCVYFSIQLAVYMGFKEIYLLGVDNTVGKLKFDHFTHNYLGEGYTPDKEKGIRRKVAADNWIYTGDYAARTMEFTMESVRTNLESRGIKIYNATRGGELEVLERIGFDSLFKY